MVDRLINDIEGALMDLTSFIATVPGAVANYAGIIYNVGQRYSIAPTQLAVMMWRESKAGTVLRPPGSAGTGDFTKRPAGRQYRQPSGAYYMVSASGMPEDGAGWGRGLMQIDYGVHNEWVTANDWTDPEVNIDKAAQLYYESRQFFSQAAGAPITVDAWRLARGMPEYGIAPWSTKYGLTSQGPYPDPRPLSGTLLEDATLAAHNAGPSGVLQAIAAGLPPEAATTGQDYVSWTKRLLGGWLSGKH